MQGGFRDTPSCAIWYPDVCFWYQHIAWWQANFEEPGAADTEGTGLLQEATLAVWLIGCSDFSVSTPLHHGWSFCNLSVYFADCRRMYSTQTTALDFSYIVISSNTWNGSGCGRTKLRNLKLKSRRRRSHRPVLLGTAAPQFSGLSVCFHGGVYGALEVWKIRIIYFIYLSMYPSFYLFVCLSTNLLTWYILSIYRSIYLSIYQSINQLTYLPVYLSIHVSIYLI